MTTDCRRVPAAAEAISPGVDGRAPLVAFPESGFERDAVLFALRWRPHCIRRSIVYMSLAGALAGRHGSAGRLDGGGLCHPGGEDVVARLPT